MLDTVMLALGLGLFVAGIGYAYACERLRGGRAMIFDYSLAGLVSLGLLFYLTYALLRPERF
ncbi:K(+)-transporting ATPase subunit F [Bradyrhizobium sp. RDT10]